MTPKRKKFLYLTLALLAIALLWLSWGLPDYLEARRIAAELNEAEGVILALSRDFKKIGHDLENLALPGRASRRLFANEVEANSIGAQSTPDHGPAWTVETKHLEWPSNDDLAAHSIDSWNAWQPFLRQLSHFRHLSVKVGLPPAEGDENPNRFIDKSRQLFLASVGVVGLAVDLDDRPLAFEAHVEVLVRRHPAEDGDERDSWRIERWKTLDLGGTSVPRTLFDDVTQAAFRSDLDHRLARTSNQHELVVDYYLKEEEDRPAPLGFGLVSAQRHPGLAIVDLDGDGWDDIYILPRYGSTLFFRNLGDGTFVEEAAARGLDIEDHCAGAIFADFDNDGDLDVFVARTLERSIYLENEDNHFANKSTERFDIELPSWVTSVSAVDYDQDGLLDIYLARYGAGILRHHLRSKRLEYLLTGESTLMENFLDPEVASRLYELTQADGAHDYLNRPGPPNVLLRNMGQGRFGVAPVSADLEIWKNTFQSTWADYDNDGDPDVYLANDFAPNNLFRNDGEAGFTDVTAPTETADVGFGMGVTWGDYDRDGLQDLYVTNMYSKAGQRIVPGYGEKGQDLIDTTHGNTLFRNQLETFQRVSGVKEPKMLVEKAGWGWGGQFTDLDNDGHLDIYTLSGYYTAPPEVAIPEDT